MTYNLPNLLTLLRIVLIPVFVVVFYLPVPWANAGVTAIFALAAWTDWLDGYLARRLKQTSAFGAFLDPVADKLMVAVALVLLVDVNPTPYASAFLALPAALVIHGVGYFACLREPRVFDLWITKVSKCPRVRNWQRWGCNSYAP